MANSEKKLNLAEVTAIGIGGMIGGGIFAVLGLAIATAGHAVALTLTAGGVIALLTGLSYAHLGLAFRDDGGSFTYIEKAFGTTGIAGVAGWLLVAGYVGTLALYASAFGAYGATLFTGTDTSPWIVGGLSLAVLGGFLAINLIGAKLSGGVELGVVAVKLAILALFAAVGVIGVHVSHFEPLFDQGHVAPLVAVALIFVAYEGFELIPNAVDEMADPGHNLKRALVLAIMITAAIYVVVAIAAQGHLTPAQIQHDQEYVLAVAARPMLGQAGFVLIGVAALLSTASAINATLFGAARLAMVMASEHALPRLFARRERNRPIPYIALIVLACLAASFTLGAGLPVIASFASATFLLIFTGVNFAALRLAPQIGINRLIPLAGGLLAAAGFVILMWHDWRAARASFICIVTVYAAAAAIEGLLCWRKGPRNQQNTAHIAEKS